jgi:hypothetical protein
MNRRVDTWRRHPGAVTLAVSFVLAAAFSWAAVAPVVAVLNGAARAPQLTLPVDHDLAVSPGDWAVYVTSGNLVGGSEDVEVDYSSGVCSPSSDRYLVWHETRSWRGREFTQVLWFHVNRSGTCHVQGRDNPGVRIAVAPDITSRIQRGWPLQLAALCADLVLVVVAAELLHRRVLRARGRYPAP